MALQRLGKSNMVLLLHEMGAWSGGSWLEKRAAAAALAEPVLLKNPNEAYEVLRILDAIIASMHNSADAGSADFKVLEKGMSYCWSVAVVAAPQAGKRLMEKWLACEDIHIRRIMQENLKKNRLERMDAAWVEKWRVSPK